MPVSVKKPRTFHFEYTRIKMEVPLALNVAPLNTPYRDLDYLSLVDKDFQIKDLNFTENPLRIYCRCKDNYLNGSDIIGLWESSLPRYLFPSVISFLKLSIIAMLIMIQIKEQYYPQARTSFFPLLLNPSMICYIFSLVKPLLL